MEAVLVAAVFVLSLVLAVAAAWAMLCSALLFMSRASLSRATLPHTTATVGFEAAVLAEIAA